MRHLPVIALAGAALAAACGSPSPAARTDPGRVAASASTYRGPAPTGWHCEPHRQAVYVEPAPDWPKTVAQAAAGARQILLADAVSQTPYWRHDAAGEPPDGFTAWTRTEYKVVRVLKGTAGSTISLEQEGSPPNSLPCPGRAYPANNEYLPQIGRRYLLFVWWLPGDSAPEPQGSYFRLVVTGDMVETEAALNPDDLALPLNRERLSDLERSLGLAS